MTMLRPNIRDIYTNFNGSGVLSGVLESTSMHRPSWIEAWIKRHKRFVHPAAEDKELSLYIAMDADTSRRGPKDKLTLTFMEYVDYENDMSADFNLSAKNIAEFEINLTDVLGKKDWDFYKESKDMHIIDIRTPDQGKALDAAMENMHNFLAAKLFRKFEEIGFKEVMSDETYTAAEQKLIGLFMDYRALAKNPNLLMRRLGL